MFWVWFFVMSCFQVLLCFFPFHIIRFTQVTCLLFHSCTPSTITSAQYLVSRFSSVLCKILTSLHATSFTFFGLDQVRFCLIFHSHSLVLFKISCFPAQPRFLFLFLWINQVFAFDICIWVLSPPRHAQPPSPVVTTFNRFIFLWFLCFACILYMCSALWPAVLF